MANSDAVKSIAEQYAVGDISESEAREAINALGGDPDELLGTDDDPDEYTTVELRQMSDAEAAEQLTDAQQERRDKLLELDDQAEATNERWDEERETVGNVVIRSDPETLGTELELFDNKLLVQINTDKQKLRDNLTKLAEFENDMAGEGDLKQLDIDWDAREDQLAAAKHVFDAILLKWNDTLWEPMREPRRMAILDEVREKWGREDFMVAVVNAANAATQRYEDLEEQSKSFRGEGGSGDR